MNEAIQIALRLCFESLCDCLWGFYSAISVRTILLYYAFLKLFSSMFSFGIDQYHVSIASHLEKQIRPCDYDWDSYIFSVAVGLIIMYV